MFRPPKPMIPTLSTPFNSGVYIMQLSSALTIMSVTSNSNFSPFTSRLIGPSPLINCLYFSLDSLTRNAGIGHAKTIFILLSVVLGFKNLVIIP